MSQVGELTSEVGRLRERLSKLSEASLRINESLEFDEVLQGVLDSARQLIGAQFGVMVLVDVQAEVVDFLSSGFTSEQNEDLWGLPEKWEVLDAVFGIENPLRVRDLPGHLQELGLPEVRFPVPRDSGVSFLGAPIRYQGERVGGIFLAEKENELLATEAEEGFTSDDEETLVMFASQAAHVISNARRYQQELQARVDLETLVNTAPLGLVVFDAETGATRSVSREARRIVRERRLPEGSLEDLLSALVFSRADGRKISPEGTSIVEALSLGETVRDEEIVIEIPGGQNIVLLVNATPVRSHDGKLESVMATFQDMTQQSELERLRAEFLGIVGHELRKPLASVKGSVATLLETESSLDPAEVSQYHRIISEQADYMRDLVGNLIDVVRIDTGTLSVDPEPLEVPRVVDEARNTFISAGGRDNVRINLVPELPLVFADRRRLVQVFGNLLTNASRSSHETSTIRIDAVADDVHVAFSVSDDGRGVAAEWIPHLFSKYSRPPGSNQSRDLDLGLAICKGIVEAHGGRIWAESDGPGLGSRFTFTIPTAEEGTDRAIAGGVRSGARAPRSSGSDQPRVLAVDDDPRTLKFIRDALQGEGCDPVVTGDPQQVADLIEEANPQLVLLDMMIPGTDGMELMRDIQMTGGMPVILLSAFDQEDLIAKAFEMGAVDYIVKPFSTTELAARVKAALRKRSGTPASYLFDELAIDYAQRSVSVAGRIVDLTPTEYRLLVELSANPGVALTHDQLQKKIWGPNSAGDFRPMRTMVKNLRHKLGDLAKSPRYIITVPRVGYRMPRPEPQD